MRFGCESLPESKDLKTVRFPLACQGVLSVTLLPMQSPTRRGKIPANTRSFDFVDAWPSEASTSLRMTGLRIVYDFG